MLFSEVLEMWWVGNKLSLRDITTYKKRMVIDTHILPFFEDMEISSIDDVTINNFIYHEIQSGNHLNHNGLCHNSINKEIGIIRAVLDYAFKKGYVDSNPSVLIKWLRKDPYKKYKIYTFDEVNALINAARPKWLGDMILLVYNTGMRKCECFGLQWSDIDFNNKRLTVVRSVTAAKPNDRFISEPKTRTSKRIILLDDRTLLMLKSRYDKRASDTWVFANKYGQLLSPWYSTKYFGIARNKVGVQGRFYDLRHTHITDLVVAGVSLPIIQIRAGHSDIRMTMHYTHIDAESQSGAVDIINNRYNNVPGR